MSSTRSKLMLDEQSFQGLLAAAFTIQQHNERQSASGSNSSGKEDPLKQTAEVCPQCGVPFPAGRAQCPSCDTANLRPGERLQRTWASMWLMSQEKLMGAEDREKPAADAPPFQSKATNGHALGSEPSGPAPLLAKPATGDFIPVERVAAEHTPDASSAITPQNEPAASDPPRDGHAVVIPVLEGRGSDDLPGEDHHVEIPSTDDLMIDSPLFVQDSLVVAGSGSSGGIHRGSLDLRVKLRFHRADLYLGIAIVVAFLALLFPATATQRPTLRPWERMLIAIGIAEEPQPVAVHHAGDPNIKVWVDTHTALYYCPGAELYGKSPNGYYSTQREAQSDHFEPAERVVCVE
jgi:hypothetical protein